MLARDILFEMTDHGDLLMVQDRLLVGILGDIDHWTRSS
jgi:hypothetical protein